MALFILVGILYDGPLVDALQVDQVEGGGDVIVGVDIVDTQLGAAGDCRGGVDGLDIDVVGDIRVYTASDGGHTLSAIVK